MNQLMGRLDRLEDLLNSGKCTPESVCMELAGVFGVRITEVGTALERAQSGTIRLKLLKLGAMVRVSVRRVVLSLSAAAPIRELFRRIAQLLDENVPLLA